LKPLSLSCMKNLNKNKTLILTRRDIHQLIDMRKAMAALQKAFSLFGRGRSQMPPKIYLHLDRFHGDFRAMPVYLEGLSTCAIKWVNVHAGNKSKHLPTVMAVIILSDPRTGFPLAVMDGTLITNLRTGAAGGIAAKYLARQEARTVGLVGCGEQAKTQLEALAALFKIKEVKVWGNKKSYVDEFLKRMKTSAYVLKPASSVKECVRDCDIVVTTTPVRKPLVKLEWLKAGVHINAIGADAKGKQELDAAILKKGKIIIDDWKQASHSGEINVPLSQKQITRADIHAELAQVILGKRTGRTNAREITVFDSTGLAIQDVALADQIYQEALKKKRGRWVNLVGV